MERLQLSIPTKICRIKIAREKYGSQMNLKVLEGSSEDYPAGPYNIVFSSNVIHSIPSLIYTRVQSA